MLSQQQSLLMVPVLSAVSETDFGDQLKLSSSTKHLSIRVTKSSSYPVR